jgi:histone H3
MSGRGVKTVHRSTGGKAPRKTAGKHVGHKAPMREPKSTNEKKPHRFKPGTVALREIKKMQKSTDTIIPRRPFERLLKFIMSEFKPEARIQAVAVDALQQALEAYLVANLEDSQLCAIHAKRITVMPKDLDLTTRIKGDKM